MMVRLSSGANFWEKFPDFWKIEALFGVLGLFGLAPLRELRFDRQFGLPGPKSPFLVLRLHSFKKVILLKKLGNEGIFKKIKI